MAEPSVFFFFQQSRERDKVSKLNILANFVVLLFFLGKGSRIHVLMSDDHRVLFKRLDLKLGSYHPPSVAEILEN